MDRGITILIYTAKFYTRDQCRQMKGTVFNVRGNPVQYLETNLHTGFRFRESIAVLHQMNETQQGLIAWHLYTSLQTQPPSIPYQALYTDSMAVNEADQ